MALLLEQSAHDPKFEVQILPPVPGEREWQKVLVTWPGVVMHLVE
jgi:hypothetical protein